MLRSIDLQDLKKRIYALPGNVILDNRFIWRKILPGPGAPGILIHDWSVSGGSYVWNDRTDRYQILRCAHPEDYRDYDRCMLCGQPNPYQPTSRGPS